LSNNDVFTEAVFQTFGPPAIMLEHIERSRSSRHLFMPFVHWRPKTLRAGG